jgi:hypothetical protein
MIGNLARPGGSLGEMLHQLREQAEGAASRFLLQVLTAACADFVAEVVDGLKKR